MTMIITEQIANSTYHCVKSIDRSITEEEAASLEPTEGQKRIFMDTNTFASAGVYIGQPVVWTEDTYRFVNGSNFTASDCAELHTKPQLAIRLAEIERGIIFWPEPEPDTDQTPLTDEDKEAMTPAIIAAATQEYTALLNEVTTILNRKKTDAQKIALLNALSFSVDTNPIAVVQNA
jgi:hypothetical protein